MLVQVATSEDCEDATSGFDRGGSLGSSKSAHRHASWAGDLKRVIVDEAAAAAARGEVADDVT